MNILIVESENDQYFIEALVKELLSEEIDIYKIDEYIHSSVSEDMLTKQITSALTDVARGVSKIGILLDMDDFSKEERINLVNKCLIKSCSYYGYLLQSELVDICSFITCQTDNNLSVQISCYFTNVDGQGELETILKEIKLEDSTFADCLYTGWLNCLISKGKTFSQKRGESCDISGKELLKLWVDFYKRFDTLKRQKRDDNNTDWKGIMTGVTKKNIQLANARGSNIFDLNSSKLDGIKSFLKMFS